MKRRIVGAIALCLCFAWGASAGILDGLSWPKEKDPETTVPEPKSSKPKPIKV